MSRSFLFSVLLLSVTPVVVGVACHHDPEPHHAKPGEYPPLPPASGTPVGYIVDAATDLKLRDEQLNKLKDLDSKLAAQDDEIDTQLRQIEKPEDPGPQDPNEKPKRPQHAPQARGKRGARAGAPGGGAGKGSNSPEANKLHEMQDTNDRVALEQAFAILDEQQRISVRKLLLDHGVEPPDEPKGTKTPLPPTGDGAPPPTPGAGGMIPGTDVPGEQ